MVEDVKYDTCKGVLYITNEFHMQGRTGLSPQSYSAALKKLVKRGWVSHRNYQTIRVNFNKIYEDGREYDEYTQDVHYTSDSSRSMPDEDCYSMSD